MTLPSPTMQRCWAVRLQHASTCRISLSTHMQTHAHADTHALPQLTRTHTYTDSHTHGHRHTHTETHTLPQLPRLNTSHLTDNSHSDILRDEKCFRATRRLVCSFLISVLREFVGGLNGWLAPGVLRCVEMRPCGTAQGPSLSLMDSAAYPLKCSSRNLL